MGGVIRLVMVYVPLLALGIAGNKAALAVDKGIQPAVRVKIDVPAGRSAPTVNTTLEPEVAARLETVMLVAPWVSVPPCVVLK